MLIRGFGILVTVLCAITIGGPAWADGIGTPGGGKVECGTTGCHVVVGTPGKPGDSSGSGGNGGGSGGDENPCVFEIATPGPESIAAVGGQPAGPGQWYFRHCFSGTDGTGVGFGALVWLADPPPAISPAVLARIGRAQMDLPAVVVAVNPQANTLVQVPMWLAVTGGWQPRSATASVPGVAVTVTATPSKVVWSMGDGGSVTCRGPGDVFRPGTDDPYAASPTCGFRYRRSSGSVRFTVTATVSYTVTWSGGGQAGTLDDLTAAGTTSLHVGESQAIVTQ